MLRLHPPLLKAVSGGLREVLDQGRPVDKALLPVRRNRKFGSRDRRLAAEALYDIVRYLRLYRETARLAPAASIPEEWQWIMIWLTDRGTEFDARLLEPSEQQTLPARWKTVLEECRTSPAVAHSFPDWMWERGSEDHGADWPALAEALNQPAGVFLRVNTLKISREALIRELEEMGLAPQPTDSPDGIRLPDRDPQLGRSKPYDQGFFEFQDLASQQVALLSDARRGQTVIDTCAGAGGKTLHLAALMRNEGRLIASDHLPRRMKQLEFRAKRAGASILETVAEADLGAWEGNADAVVIDAPCTSTGTIARKPAVKWRTTPDDLEKWVNVQRQLLDQHCRLVRPGGRLVFATCSIFRAEGEDQTRTFLEQHPDFQLTEEQRFLPQTYGTDGFYVVCFTRSA